MEKQFEEIIYSRYQARIRDMRILKVDEGFEQILGYSAEDVERLQLHVKDIMLDEDWEDYTKIIYAKMSSVKATVACPRDRNSVLKSISL